MNQSRIVGRAVKTEGYKVCMIERDLSDPDWIVGELLKPDEYLQPIDLGIEGFIPKELELPAPYSNHCLATWSSNALQWLLIRALMSGVLEDVFWMKVRAQQKFSHTSGKKGFARIRGEEIANRRDGQEPTQGQRGPQRTSSTGVSSHIKKASSTANIVDDLNSIFTR
ncbi:hypothetical protein Tco_0550237 [Tanacetum coccineum]